MVLSDCQARSAIELIASEWTVVTIFALSKGPLRHGELVELIGGVSRKVLTQTLRRLQASGIVERRVYAEAPPRVEYSLTEFGRTLEQPIAMLTEWARSNGEAIARSQEAGTEAADAGGTGP